MLRYLCSLIVTMSLLTLPMQTQAEIAHISTAINKAGMQRMLSQRMVKSYLLLGMGVDSAAAKQQLQSDLTLFESHLDQLQQFSQQTEHNKAISTIRAIWAPLNEQLSQPAQKKYALSISQSADQLLKASHQLVVLLERSAGTSHANLVNVAGKQRMLSQRIAKLHLLKSWGINNSEIESELNRVREEIRGAIGMLVAAPENTRAIIMALIDAEKQWHKLNHSLDQYGDRENDKLIASTSDRLMSLMNRVVTLYEEEATK